MMARHDMTSEVRAALNQGDITAAMTLCRAWLDLEPASAEAHFFSGISALRSGEVEDALRYFTRATELAPEDARAWSNLGIAGRQAGKDAQWITTCLQKASRLAPGNPDICFNLALALNEQGMDREALEALQAWPVDIQLSEKAGWLKASLLHALGFLNEARDLVSSLTDLYPHLHEFWRALGDLHRELADATQAEISYRQALQLAPEDLESLRGLGNLLVTQGRAEEGRQLLRRVFEQAGDRVESHVEYAQALAACSIFIDARQVLQTALDRWPEYAELYFNLGLIHGECGNPELAEKSVHRALELNPDLYLARNYLGILLEKRSLQAEAESCYRQVIAQVPVFAEAHNNLANLLVSRRELAAAENSYRTSIALKSDFAEAHHNLGLLLLLTERYVEGWQEYRWRWRTPDGIPHVRVFNRPEWQGQALAGKRLLVHAEQGFGDTIQFVRYMEELTRRGATVIFESPPALHRLLHGMSGIDTLLKRGDPIPECDWHVPLLDIPGLVGTRVDNISASAAYLAAECTTTQKWASRLSEYGQAMLRVGIVWAGNPKHTRDRERSIPPGELSPLASLERVQWVNLYKAPKGMKVQSGMPFAMIDWTEELNDYAETAALIAGLDLVIAVDTSVAHLAGALGKPVWILLPYVPDWRWMLDRKTSPWYPSATLYRQDRPGSWDAVVNSVKRELSKIGQKKAP